MQVRAPALLAPLARVTSWLTGGKQTADPQLPPRPRYYRDTDYAGPGKIFLSRAMWRCCCVGQWASSSRHRPDIATAATTTTAAAVARRRLVPIFPRAVDILRTIAGRMDALSPPLLSSHVSCIIYGTGVYKLPPPFPRFRWLVSPVSPPHLPLAIITITRVLTCAAAAAVNTT